MNNDEEIIPEDDNWIENLSELPRFDLCFVWKEI